MPWGSMFSPRRDQNAHDIQVAPSSGGSNFVMQQQNASGQKEDDAPKLEVSGCGISRLQGNIPLPRTETQQNARGQPEAASRNRARWGPVWESSHYFNHHVYRYNEPKLGMPVDTSGNGKADGLAFDLTGDGKVDLIVRDDRSEQLALERQAALRRSLSLDQLCTSTERSASCE